jgi:hypothetical protein
MTGRFSSIEKRIKSLENRSGGPGVKIFMYDSETGKWDPESPDNWKAAHPQCVAVELWSVDGSIDDRDFSDENKDEDDL